MKKAQIADIAGQSFHIDEDAYKQLDKYLKRIGAHYDDKEIIKDIEFSMAEKLSSRLTKSKTVINSQDVADCMEELGTVDDITDEDSGDNSSGNKSANRSKSLFRSCSDKYLGGVAGGLAAYLGIDSLLVRIAFVLVAVFSSGWLLVLYVLMWIFLPQADSPEQEQTMLGQNSTLKDIEKSIKNKVNLNRTYNSKPQAYVAKVIAVIGLGIKYSMQLVGCLLMASALVIGTLWSLFAFSVVAGNEKITIDGTTIEGFPLQSSDYLFAVAAWLSVIILLMLIGYLALSLAKFKVSITASVLSVLAALLLVSTTTAAGTFVVVAGHASNIKVVHTEQVLLPAELAIFHSVEVHDDIKLELKYSNTPRVSITANIVKIDSVSTLLVDDKLVLKDNGNQNDFCHVWCSDGILITVYTDSLELVRLYDTAELTGSDLGLKALELHDDSFASLSTNNLTSVVTYADSSAHITINKAEDTELSIMQTGSSEVALSCELLGTLSFKQSEGAQLKAVRCPADHVVVDQTGAAVAHITANKTFKEVRSTEDSKSFIYGDAAEIE